jgi:hypothetical protein
VAGGWQVNGIIAAHTGQAVTPLMSTDFSNTGSFAYRPDVISDPYRAGAVPSNPDSSCALTISQGGRAADRVHTLTTWYNPCAFAVPALAPGQTFAHVFGNARRGSLRGPGAYNVDFSLFKDFKFTETWNLQFRAEAFNFFNHPQFGTPANTVDVAGFSGQVTSAGRGRELQFALKLTF